MSGERETIGILGAGWVGLVTAACFADLGHRVIVRDVIPERIEQLQAGEVPIYEPDLSELIERNRERMTFTLEMADVAVEADFLFVCVGTPPTYSGDADLSAVWAVVDELPALGPGKVLIMKSTVPAGTGERVRSALEARELGHVAYASNPEFLAEGRAIEDFVHPDRIVIGSFDPSAAERVGALYAGIEAPIVYCDVASAEMVKLASNAFLATRISFINEIANVCELTGADVERVAEGMGLDRRIGPHFLHAGIGYGGSCFPKDVAALKQLAGNSGYHFQLLSSVIEVNELQKRRVVGKLEKRLGPLAGKAIAILGLTFKPETNDMREAASIVLGSRLLAEGAEVRAWDPLAERDSYLRGASLCDTILEAVTGADAAVIVTEWKQLRELASEEVRRAMRNPLIVDGRNLLDPDQVKAAGFAYECVGRPGRCGSSLGEAEAREAKLE
jgi:UDPglucose 6-dehydrogenase